MDVSETSLENLQPGRVTTKAEREAGKNLILAAIVEALRHTVQDDDAVRKHLCKVNDFEVTEAARSKVLESKAELVYSAIFGGIVKKVAVGEDVSINGFATFKKVIQVSDIEVAFAGNTVYGGNYYPILPTDKIVSVERTARMGVESWDGVTIGNEYYLDYRVTSFDATEYDAVHGVYIPWEGRRWSVSLSQHAYVDSVSSDGVSESRHWYQTTKKLYGNITLRQLVDGGDWEAYLIVSAQDKIDFLLDWDQFKAKKLEDLDQRSVLRGAIGGVCVDEFLRAFPKKGRLVVRSGTYGARMELWSITPIEYRTLFGWNEYAMREQGIWRERVRNFGNTVQVKFRNEFIEATQSPV